VGVSQVQNNLWMFCETFRPSWEPGAFEHSRIIGSIEKEWMECFINYHYFY
jgi:hypothetical protein